MCWKRCCAALTSVAVRRKTWGAVAKLCGATAAELTIMLDSCDADRGSGPRLGGTRQALQQVSAPWNSHQAEYPAPKPPRVGVEFHQRQTFVQMPQWFMHDHARGCHRCGSAARREAQLCSVRIPFDAQ